MTIGKTAVVLGIKKTSVKKLEEELSVQGFEVVTYVPTRRLGRNDIVIASPAYESPEMAEFVTQMLRKQVGPDVPVILLSEQARPAYGPPGIHIVPKSIGAISNEVARLHQPSHQYSVH